MGEKYNATDRCSSLDRLLSRNGTVLIRGDAPLRRGLDRILTADLLRHLKYQSVRYSFTVVIISTGQMRAVFYWDFNRKKRLIRFGSLLQLPQYPLPSFPLTLQFRLHTAKQLESLRLSLTQWPSVLLGYYS